VALSLGFSVEVRTVLATTCTGSMRIYTPQLGWKIRMRWVAPPHPGVLLPEQR
jgi:hypothetical protein